MFEIWGIPSPYKSEPKAYLFRRLRNLTAIAMAYIFGMKHDIRNRVVHWQLEGVSYTVLKRHELWSANGLKLDLHFAHPP